MPSRVLAGAGALSAGRRLVIKGGLVVASDGRDHGLMPGATIVVEDDTIRSVGAADAGAADEVIDAAGRLVVPGFVNLEACTYVDFQGFANDRGHANYYGPSGFNFAPRRGRIGRKSEPVSEVEARACAVYGLAQCVAGGSTTIVGTDYGGTHPAYADMLAESATTLGARAYFAKAFGSGVHYVTDEGGGDYHWDLPAGDRGLEASIAYADELAHRRAEGRVGDVHGMIFPYRFDAMSEGHLRACRDAANRTGHRLRMHAAQFLMEFYEQVRRTSETPLECLERIGFLGPDVLIHHAILTTEHSWIPRSDGRDVRILAETGTAVGHCPTIFARRAVMLESFGRYTRAGVRMGLGTDCVPQDMIVVMGWAASLSKIADRNVNSATAADVLRAATIGGADALGRPDLGRIQPGAKADFLLVRPSSLRLGPIDDPIRNLVYLGSQHDIDEVWIGGRRVVDHGAVRGVDAADVLRHMQAHMDRQRARFLEAGLDRGLDPFPPSLPTWELGTRLPAVAEA